MRLIDADRLLEERRLHLYYHLSNGDTAIPIIDIKHAPTVNNDGWIPVSERLPETGKAVLVCCDGKFHDAMVVAYIDALGLWHPISGDHIAYWMPLPELPKEGDGK